ncbi:MAG: PSD1 domain-containing protein [Planctomycetia bacterium]|nr:PSD1 domain-containing protein [Planctomycetia bacterium]
MPAAFLPRIVAGPIARAVSRLARRSGAATVATACLAILALVAVAARQGRADEARVKFNRDIRPILAENCYACHGPDKNKRESDLRLDTRDGAFAELGDHRAIVPGKPHESELLRRVTADDESVRMPPPASGKTLTPRQIDLLRTWIAEGATWQDHWSYTPIERPRVPQVASQPANPIDAFIAARLADAGVAPAAEADRVTLARRLAFDLVGLPPSAEQVTALVNDSSADSYERLVDALLASPHYGERMAMQWLDLVRYADTTGIHGDNHRDVAPYRDYVIDAFNANMPFDRFVVEQLAGDLLPQPTLAQRVASGYNRMNMTTTEGGAQPKEYIAKYAADRVRNASTVYLGATLGCAECHDHKYDPFTTKDFYSFAAFFADVQEQAVALPGPPFPVPKPEQESRLAELDRRLTELRGILDVQTPELDAAQLVWEGDARRLLADPPKLGAWHVLGSFAAKDFKQAFEREFGPESGVDLAAAVGDGAVKWTARPEWADGEIHNVAPANENAATYVYRTIDAPRAMPLVISLGSDDGLRVWLDKKEVLNKRVERPAAPDQDKVTLSLRQGVNHLLMKVVNAAGGCAFYFKPVEGDIPAAIVEILTKPAGERTDEQKQALAKHHRGLAPLLQPVRDKIAAVERERKDVDAGVLRTLVAMSGEPRTMRVLRRGNWLDESGEIVQPAAPAFLKPPAIEGRRATRLDLANWMASRDNPLVARVLVNRLWKLAFGRGLASPLDDLGAQGSWPTHLELLDWLAAEFIDSGRDVKHVLRLIVTSRTYRQSSHAGAELLQKDPYNLLLARQGRFRLDAEMVRDNALAIGGLLVPKIGGRSVKPYQPRGYWAHLNFPVREYEADHGEDLYRRGLYTYWCRTFLHPSLLAFDAPTREECTAERNRSNTPLQALVLLNDPIYVETARVFAERMLRQSGASEERIGWAFGRALSRQPTSDETRVLVSLAEKHREHYAAHVDEARKLVATGEWPVPQDVDPAELAAWTSVARTILNLHETMTRY